MQAVTLKDAERNLPRLVEQVLADAEPRIVVNDKGEQVVVMPLDEFNSWKETQNGKRGHPLLIGEMGTPSRSPGE